MFADSAGMRQMMWGDVEAGTMHMKPMHAFTAQEVVFSSDRRRLDSMPGPARTGLLSVIAAYLPYYTSEREVPVVGLCICVLHSPGWEGHCNPTLQTGAAGHVRDAIESFAAGAARCAGELPLAGAHAC